MKNVINITQDDNWRKILKVIKTKFNTLPLTNIFKLFRKWEIKINWKNAKEDDEVKTWDEIVIFTKEIISQKTKISNKISESFFRKNFKVIYEDEWILAVNKPAWIAVHPGTKHYQGKTMIDLAEHYIKNKYWKSFIQLVHRIDSDTSWVLIFAKNWQILRDLNELIKEKKVTKHYTTLVFWKVKNKSWKIVTQIEKKEWEKFNSMIIPDKKTENSQEAITHYKVKEYFWDLASLLDIDLKTWKMHQIRVHTKSIWHPIVLDKMYWDFKKNREFENKFWLKRQFLHAYLLEFTHPTTWQKIKINAELSSDLKACLNILFWKSTKWNNNLVD